MTSAGIGFDVANAVFWLGSCGIASIVLVLIVVISTRNRAIHLENLLRESWANVDVALKRRHDLIPNLVSTVKAYASHEQAVFERIVQARGEALNALADLVKLRALENEISTGINQVLATAEGYPDLKASEQFLNLQNELAVSEDRIAAARRFYNSNVREFNTFVSQFPASMLVGSKVPKEYFEIDEVQVSLNPKVEI